MQERRSREFWMGVVREFERVGGGHEAYAASKGLNVATFRVWLYRLRREGRQRVPKLVPLRVAPSASSSVVEIAVAGVVLRVAADVEPQRVSALVSALETRAC